MAEEFRIPIDDTYMHVVKLGRGQKVLVILSGASLCGLEGQGDAIAAAYELFAKKYTVYLMGRRSILPASFRVPEMADDIYRILKSLKVDEADVYGVCLGGMTALWLAAEHPDLVHKLVVCSSYTQTNDLMQKNIREWVGYALSHDVVNLNRSFFRNVYSKAFLEQVKDLLPELEKQGSSDDCERMAVMLQSCVEFDISDRLNEIRCPVFAIGDRQDRVLGIKGTIDLVEKLKCGSYIYNGYSHAVYDEAPDIKQKIFDFFEKE